MLGLLLAAATDPILIAREQLRVTTPRCQPGATQDIVVCGRRAADRWRVPFVGPEPGTRAAESVAQERGRVQARTTPRQERGYWLVGCGSGVGLTASIGLGGGGMRVRPLSD